MIGSTDARGFVSYSIEVSFHVLSKGIISKQRELHDRVFEFFQILLVTRDKQYKFSSTIMKNTF